MNHHLHRTCVGLVSLCVWLGLQSAWAATQSQTLSLNYGWNAVWLGVEPVNGEGDTRFVDDVFAPSGFVIDIVTRPLDPVGTAEFIDDPEATFNQPDWLVWYANPPSGENDRYPAHGHQAYLVHVTPTTGAAADGLPAGTLSVVGDVNFFRPNWKAGQYHLLGFQVVGATTFADYLAALSTSSGTLSDPGGSAPVVQKLDSTSGNWVGVSLNESIQAGQAYWVWAPYSLSTIHYSGPVSVRFNGSGDLDFGSGPGTIEVADPEGNTGETLLLSREEITLTNLEKDESHTVTMRKVSPTSEDLRVFALEPEVDSLAWRIVTGSGGDPISTWTTATLAPSASKTVTLGGDRNWTSGATARENLYRIEVTLTSGSYYFWLPVTAQRSDLSSAPLLTGTASPDHAGLWVGDVAVNKVTSLAENGDPIKHTTSTLPLEIILHFDGTNAPVLLSHVMFMRTTSADESVPSEPILVIDESKIPFFEGIEERNGKLVGRRLESAAYDMPRKMDPTTQAALAAAASLSTEAGIQTYVNGQTQRPPSLVESYHLTWPLVGLLAPNATLRTASAAAGDAEDRPLALDPFHRSNPFRHAFHPSHGAGFAVSRSLTISFDDHTDDDLLQGTYREDLTGLVASATPLSLEGTITLRRVSAITSLK